MPFCPRTSAAQPGTIGRRCRAPASFRQKRESAVPVFDRMTSRRGFIRAAAAAGTTTAAAATSAPAAAISRAALPMPDPACAAAGPDALLVALEREVLDVHARLAALRGGSGTGGRRTPEEEAER